jgi:hypothetical protein
MANSEKKEDRSHLFRGGADAINRSGRPVKDRSEVKTNRELRADQFMQLVRKFRPHLSKAVQVAVTVMNNEKASDTNRLRAAAFIIQTNKELVKELYDYRYDDEGGEEIQESGSVFSLKIIENDTEDKDT